MNRKHKMSEELKPCPKCGRADLLVGFYGFCGVHADDEETARKVWNTRTKDTPK